MGSQLAAKIEAALTQAMKEADFTIVHGAHYALCTQGQDALGTYAPRLALAEVAEIAAQVANPDSPPKREIGKRSW
jgi:hypothetical protein